jgi:hypothetical protein
MFRPMHLLVYPEGSLKILKKGEKLSKELSDRKSLTAFYNIIGAYYAFKKGPVEAIRYAEPRFYEAQKNKDMELMARISTSLFNAYFSCGNYLKIADLAPGLIELIEKTETNFKRSGKPLNYYSTLCSMYGHALINLGNFKKARSLLKKGITIAVEINNIINIGII